jgi:hypothetical protein
MANPMLTLQHIPDSGAVLRLQQTRPMLYLQHGSGGADITAIADIVSLL